MSDDTQDKFYKTTIITTILSRGKYVFQDLDTTQYDMIFGDVSGECRVTSIEVSREEIAQLLEAQGSEPSFLFGDEEVEDGDADSDDGEEEEEDDDE